MMPTPWLAEPAKFRCEDRLGRELRAYLKTELLADEAWLRAQLRLRRTTAPGRVRRWFQRRARKAEASAIASAPAFRPEPMPSPEGTLVCTSSTAATGPCAHPVQEDLGGGTGVSYELCLSCRAVLVATAGGRWVIPPVSPRGWREESAVVRPPFSNYP